MQLINGDCLIEMDKLIEQGIKVDAIITDPPYGIDYDIWDVKHNNTNSALLGLSPAQLNSSGFKKRGKPINGWSKSDRDIGKEYELWLKQVCDRLFSLTKEGSPVLMFSSRRYQHKVMSALEETGFLIKDVLIWDKGIGRTKAQRINKILKNRKLDDEVFNDYRVGNLRPDYEPVVFAFKPYSKTLIDCFIDNKVGAIYCENNKVPSNIFNFKKAKTNHHPTEKPIELMEELIKIFTYKTNKILDPFMGSGSTGVACTNTNRDFIGIEIDAEKTKGKNKDQSYFDIAKERIEKATKEKETTFFI